ncbi:hypothetical protein GQ53DRAFT_758482 [Thozetella sp. PMI_491]|nr:hypothetical protein GQ53DRAFT_758482 [Thozetella sp. PMI_491]
MARRSEDMMVAMTNAPRGAGAMMVPAIEGYRDGSYGLIFDVERGQPGTPQQWIVRNRSQVGSSSRDQAHVSSRHSEEAGTLSAAVFISKRLQQQERRPSRNRAPGLELSQGGPDTLDVLPTNTPILADIPRLAEGDVLIFRSRPLQDSTELKEAQTVRTILG